MKNFILSMSSDKQGKPSVMMITSFSWVFGILGCLIYCIYKNGTFPAMQPELLYSVVGVLGVKAYQSGKEAPKIP